MSNAQNITQRINEFEKELQIIQEQCNHQEYIKQKENGQPIKMCKTCNKELGLLTNVELEDWKTGKR